MGFECAVVDRSVTSYQLTIKYGVKMGCVRSGFLFLLSWTGSKFNECTRRLEDWRRKQQE